MYSSRDLKSVTLCWCSFRWSPGLSQRNLFQILLDYVVSGVWLSPVVMLAKMRIRHEWTKSTAWAEQLSSLPADGISYSLYCIFCILQENQQTSLILYSFRSFQVACKENKSRWKKQQQQQPGEGLNLLPSPYFEIWKLSNLTFPRIGCGCLLADWLERWHWVCKEVGLLWSR